MVRLCIFPSHSYFSTVYSYGSHCILSLISPFLPLCFVRYGGFLGESIERFFNAALFSALLSLVGAHTCEDKGVGVREFVAFCGWVPGKGQGGA